MVEVKGLAVHEDDRGRLFEVVHAYELPGGLALPHDGPTPGTPRFGQVYVVHNPARGRVRAFHKHARLWDYFCIVSGSAKFCFVDDREGKVASEAWYSGSMYSWPSPQPAVRANNPGPGSCKSLVASAGSPKLIVVPPGVFHGWMSLEDNTTLLSVGSELYDPREPDEVRVSPEYFNLEFGGSPWEIKGR